MGQCKARDMGQCKPRDVGQCKPRDVGHSKPRATLVKFSKLIPNIETHQNGTPSQWSLYWCDDV